MTDTLRVMQLIDQLGTSRNLDEVCALLTSSPALGQRIDGASLLLLEDNTLNEHGRAHMPGAPADFSRLRLSFPTPLALALASPQATSYALNSTDTLHPDISSPLETSGFASVWMLPLTSRLEPFALLMAFSRQAAEKPVIAPSHEKLLASSVKLAIRHTKWRVDRQSDHPRLAG